MQYFNEQWIQLALITQRDSQKLVQTQKQQKLRKLRVLHVNIFIWNLTKFQLKG